MNNLMDGNRGDISESEVGSKISHALTDPKMFFGVNLCNILNRGGRDLGETEI